MNRTFPGSGLRGVEETTPANLLARRLQSFFWQWRACCCCGPCPPAGVILSRCIAQKPLPVSSSHYNALLLLPHFRCSLAARLRRDNRAACWNHNNDWRYGRHAGAFPMLWSRRASLRASASSDALPPVELGKNFDFSSEERLYNWWEGQGYFKPDAAAEGVPFVIPMPPPNVTGALHMGHAMFVTLEDIMARFWRMRGRPTLWMPGTDHADQWPK